MASREVPSTYHSLRGRRPTPHRRGDQRMSTSSIQGQLHRSNLPCFAPPLGWAYPTHMSDWLHGIDIFETVAGTAFDVPNSICYLNFNRNRNGCPKKTTQVRTDMTTQSIDSVQDDSVHSAIRNDVQQTTRHFGTAPVHISIAVIILVLACGHYPPQGRTREILTGRSYPVGHPQLNILQTLKQGKGRISRDHTHIPFDNDLTTPAKLQLRSTWDSTVISIAFRMRDVSDNHCSMEGQSNRNFRPSQQHPSNASVPHVSPIKQPELLYMIKTLHSLHNKRTTNISSYGYSNGSSIHNDGGTITGNVTTGITSSNMTQLNRTQGITHSKPNDSLNCSIHLISVSNTDPGENLPGQFIQRNAIFFEVISSEYRKPMSRSNFLDALFGSPAEGTEFQSHVTHMHGPSWIRERGPMEPGQCWAFSGTGSVVLDLGYPVAVDGLSINHIASRKAPNQDIRSAPRLVQLSSSVSDPKGPWIDLGIHEYQINDIAHEREQKFQYARTVAQYMRVKILSNHGGDYTCVYRINVHALHHTEP